MMTQKHFREFADRFRLSKPESREAVGQWERDVRLVADVCASSNGRFDRGRFLRVAGVE